MTFTTPITALLAGLVAGAGLEPQGVCGEPFAAQIATEIEANTRIARELNLKAE